MIECIVVCEAHEDCLVATTLADRIILAEIAWTDGLLSDLRIYRGMQPETETRDAAGVAFTTWKKLKAIAKREGIRVHGKYGRGHGKGAYVEARKALLVAERMDAARACPLLLVRDTDGSKERAAGFREAVESADGHRVVVLALPHPEMEAWVLNGFEPCDQDETVRWRAESKALGFDPCRESHLLNPGAEHTPDGKPIKKSTKRVLAVLVGADDERKRQCWQQTRLEMLHERGERTGLADFLAAVKELLAPRIGR